MKIDAQTPTRIDREADGKQELDYGVEELEKEPNIKKDELKGGLGDNKKASDFDAKQLAIGTDIEFEHTNDRKIAQEIAMDHLTEHPNYYTLLQEMEDKAKKEKVKKSELQMRWDLIKKDLDNKSAILSIEDEMQFKEEGNPEAATPQPQDEPEQGEEAQGQDELEQGESEPGEEPQESQEQGEPEQGEPEQGEPEQGEPEQGEPEQGSDKQSLFEDELLHITMKNQGYTDSQIEYILHGHIPASASSEDIKSEAEKAMSEINQVKAKNDQTQDSSHKQELHEQNKAHKDSAHKVKFDHQARMNDIDYEKAKLALEREKEAKGIKTSSQHENMTSEQELEYKGKLHQIDIDHAKRMKQLEYDIAQDNKLANELDIEHKRKLLALEYDKVKKEAVLEVKYKEEELKTKIEQLQHAHNNKTNIANEQHKHKMTQQAETNKFKTAEHKQGLKSQAADAAKTSEAELRGKDKT